MTKNITFKILSNLLILTLILNSAFATPPNPDYIENNELDNPGDAEPSLNSRNLNLDFDSDYFDIPDIEIKEKDREVGGPDADADIEIDEPKVVQKKIACLGCPSDVDVEDEKIGSIARYAFTKFLAGEVRDAEPGDVGSEDDTAPIFVKVVKAQTQVVAGIKYILDVELGWSNCSRKQYNESPNECGLDTTKEHDTCTFHIIEKEWESSVDVVHTTCNQVSSSNNDDIELVDEEDQDDSPLARKRRSVKNYGSPVEDSDSERISDIAKFAIEQLDHFDEDDKARVLVDVINANKQNDVLLDLDTNCSQLDHFDEDDKARVLVDVINANKQTVSGWLFHLKLRIAQTSCKENTNATLETCGDKIEYPYQKCEIKVLVQPWQVVQKKLVHSQCYPENMKKGKKFPKALNSVDKESHRKVGGITVLDPEDQSIQDILNFAIESLDAQSNALHTLTPVRVVYAERQLASGIKTKMVVEVGYTNCRKGPDVDRSQCTLDATRNQQVCNVTILEKPWLEQKNILGFKCSDKDISDLNSVSRNKRAILLHHLEASNIDEQSFVEYKQKYNKVYENQEEHEYRFGVFKDNMKKAKILQDNEQGTAVYGATQFADLTEEEFSARYLGLRVDLKQRMKRKRARIPVLPKVPEEFDWRHYNAVTPVKNQGMCGSCWAFSVTGNIEGAYAIKHGNLLSFSEQELVDCDKLDEGCSGGLPENAYKAIEKLGGLETESQYPYNGKGKQCRFDSSRVKAKVSNFVEVSKNETDMVSFLLKNGPISIGINANAMQFYFGGVSHPWKFLCSPKNLDHGVLIVGYGVHTYPMFNRTLPYWVVKNSWGENWGEQGYYRVYRGDGTCGVNQMATAAFVE